jgi:cinnamyl-alcohol dehydrogenase
MTKVEISQPTAEAARQWPREFALFTQLPGAESGSVELKDLQQFAKDYGTGEISASEGKLSFEDVAKAFAKKGQKVEGDGNTVGYAARDESGHLTPFKFQRRNVGPDDINIAITYAGICHSDLHQIKGEWNNSSYPMVPGHEIVGIVTEVGSNVKNFKIGDRAGVGCFVDACRDCEQCSKHEDQFCHKQVPTYNGRNWRLDNEMTFGGYSSKLVVDHRYALKVPKNLDMAAAAPLLCAGITTYSPLKYYGLDKPGMKLGVVGLGGLGHMAVKLGKAMGLEVTVISTSENKRAEALKSLGADHFIVSKNEKEMLAAAGSLHGIVDTVSAKHSIATELGLLKVDGKLILVGAPPEDHGLPAFAVIARRLTVAGSMIGGIKETQEMLDFCGKNNITCDVEIISADYVNKAMERLVKNDVHYRFSIDVQRTLLDD